MKLLNKLYKSISYSIDYNKLLSHNRLLIDNVAVVYKVSFIYIIKKMILPHYIMEMVMIQQKLILKERYC